MKNKLKAGKKWIFTAYYSCQLIISEVHQYTLCVIRVYSLFLSEKIILVKFKFLGIWIVLHTIQYNVSWNLTASSEPLNRGNEKGCMRDMCVDRYFVRIS